MANQLANTYSQNKMFDYYNNLSNSGQLYAGAAGNINNVDFGSLANDASTLAFE
jgi:hypothetical protein